MSLILTPLASDNFTRANESPLAHPPWTAVAGQLQIVSNQCEAFSVGGVSLENYTGQTLPSDQYVKATIGAWVNLGASGSFIYIAIRNDTAGSTHNCYVLLIDGRDGDVALYVYNNGVGTPIGSAIFTSTTTGDEWTLAVVGDTFHIIKNGVELAQVVDSTHPSGQYSLLGIGPDSSVSDTSVTYFEIGSVNTLNLKSLNAATTSFAGVMAKQTDKSIAGVTAPFAGKIGKQTEIMLSGATANLAATLNTAIRFGMMLLAATASFAATLNKATSKKIASVTAPFAATLAKNIFKSMAAATAPFAARVNKLTMTSFDAATSAFSGAMLDAKVTLQVLGAAMSAFVANLATKLIPFPSISASGNGGTFERRWGFFAETHLDVASNTIYAVGTINFNVGGVTVSSHTLNNRDRKFSRAQNRECLNDMILVLRNMGAQS
jgi:hypothetical protein